MDNSPEKFEEINEDHLNFMRNLHDIENIKFTSEVICYFSSTLTETDLYFLLLTQHQRAVNSYGVKIQFLKANAEKLRYNNRIMDNSFIRLEAMNLIEKGRKGKFVYFKLTPNGIKLRNLRRDTNDPLYKRIHQEIIDVFGSPPPKNQDVE